MWYVVYIVIPMHSQSILTDRYHILTFSYVKIFTQIDRLFYARMLLHLDTHQPPFKTFVMLFKISFQSLLKAFLLTDSVYSLSFLIPTSGNPYRRGRLSTVNLLGLTSSYEVLLIMRTLFTFFIIPATLMRRSTVLSLPLQLLFPALLKAFYQLKYFK